MREYLSTYCDTAGHRTDEAVIDGTLEDSFPASDPPSFSPQTGTDPQRRHKWWLLIALVVLFAVSAVEVAAHRDRPEADQPSIPGMSSSLVLGERTLFNGR